MSTQDTTAEIGIIGAGRLAISTGRPRARSWRASSPARVVKAAIDLGDLVTGGAMQQLVGPLAGVNLIELR